MPRSRTSRYSTEYQALLDLLVELRGDRLQIDVASAMGTSQSIISKMERGVLRIDLADLLSYLDAIGADPLEAIGLYMRRINWKASKTK